MVRHSEMTQTQVPKGVIGNLESGSLPNVVELSSSGIYAKTTE